MKTYSELKAKQQEEANSFEGIFFAFDNKQFEDGMKNVGLGMDETSKIASMGAGGYILKSRAKDWVEMMKRHEKERKELRKNRKQYLASLIHELKNHEYCITFNPKQALDSLGLKKEEVPKEMLSKACKAALEGVNF